jgi:hypothetical protein
MDIDLESEALQDLVTELDSYLPLLVGRRDIKPLANDIYEALWYWRDLGQRVLKNDTRVNYPERVRGEYMLLGQLQELLRKESEEQQREFGTMLQSGRQLLGLVEAVKPPKDGHLGFLRIVRDRFRFLQTDFGFSEVDEQPTSIRFSSGEVYLELEHSIQQWSSCEFGPEESELHFSIADLLYLNHDERYKTLPDRLEMNDEAETERWFSFLSDVFKKYGSPILANRVGIFQELAKAQAERDAEFAREMELRYPQG